MNACKAFNTWLSLPSSGSVCALWDKLICFCPKRHRAQVEKYKIHISSSGLCSWRFSYVDKETEMQVSVDNKDRTLRGSPVCSIGWLSLHRQREQNFETFPVCSMHLDLSELFKGIHVPVCSLASERCPSCSTHSICSVPPNWRGRRKQWQAPWVVRKHGLL